MAMMPEAWYVEEAKKVQKQRGKELGDLAIEVDATPVVSSGSNPGAWVACWLWVPDPGTAKGEHAIQQAKPGAADQAPLATP